LYWLENEILLNVQTKVTRLYTRVEERNYRSWLPEENKLNTYTSIIHFSLCSFGIRSIIAIACPVNRLRAIEITFDHCWALYSVCDFSFVEFFLHKEGDTRSSASDKYVYLKLTIVHFWRIWFHARRHARQVTISCNALSYSKYFRRNMSFTFREISWWFRITVNQGYLCTRSIVRYYILQERVDILEGWSRCLISSPTWAHHPIDFLRTHCWFR